MPDSLAFLQRMVLKDVLHPPCDQLHKAKNVHKDTNEDAPFLQMRSIKNIPNNPWRFGNAAVFGHMQVFQQRLINLADICTTALQFSRLERVEVGGSSVGTITHSDDHDSQKNLQHAVQHTNIIHGLTCIC